MRFLVSAVALLFFLVGMGIRPYPCGNSLAVAQAKEGFTYTFLDYDCEEEFTLTCTIQVPDRWTKEVQARIAFNYVDEKNYYYAKLTASGVWIIKVAGGVHKKIGEGSAFRPSQGSLLVVIKRRISQIVLLCAGQRAAWAYDDQFQGGKIGVCAVPDAIKFDKVRYQPVEEIYFTDDFTRPQQERGLFTPVEGEWENSGLGDPKGNPNYKANPFAFKSKAPQKGLAVAGYWFWDNYIFKASVLPEQAKAVGLCWYLQDADNYFLFRWSAMARPNSRNGRNQKNDSDSGLMELIKVQNGQREVLARRNRGFLTQQWFRLAVSVHNSDITAYVDGEAVLRASCDWFGQGKVGLYVEGGEEVYFDDIEVKSWRGFSDDFDSRLGEHWKSVNGEWKWANSAVQAKSDKGAGYLWTGRGNWRDYIFGGDAKLSLWGNQKSAETSGVGLVFFFHDENNHYLFRLMTQKTDKIPRVQLIRVKDAKPEVLAEKAVAVNLKSKHRLKVETRWHGVFTGYVDDQMVVEAADFAFESGAVGFYIEGGQAVFDEVCVWFREEAHPEPPVAPQFLKEEDMAAWATGKGLWVGQASERGAIFWHRGIFFGDTDVALDWTQIPGHVKNVDVAIVRGEQNLDEGWVTSISRGSATNQIHLHIEIKDGSKTEAATDCILQGNPTSLPVRLARSGRHVLVFVDDKGVLKHSFAEVNEGHRLAVRVDRLPFQITTITARADHLINETFASAPIGWYAQRGEWQITPRWPCQTDWSWFGGSGDAVPILWSKARFYGDLVIEAYAHIAMDLPKEPGYSRPSDINISFCADGKTLSTGYSFIYAGWDNTKSALLRGEKVVAESEQHHFINPHNHNFTFHQHWFYIRIEKRGSRIKCFVDDSLVADYTDHSPMDGGQIAFWSYHNSLLLSRLRIWYERMEADTKFLKDIELLSWAKQTGEASQNQNAHEDPNNDFEVGLGCWVPIQSVGADFYPAQTKNGAVLLTLDGSAPQGKRCLKVTNAVSGGAFGVRAFVGKLDLKNRPVLKFFYKVTPEVKVNIYLRRGEVWYALTFTGSDQLPMDMLMKNLGYIKGVKANGRWHRAQFNVLEAFKRLYPNEDDFVVDEIVIGELSDEQYLPCGFGGNYYASSYWLDDFRLE